MFSDNVFSLPTYPYGPLIPLIPLNLHIRFESLITYVDSDKLHRNLSGIEIGYESTKIMVIIKYKAAKNAKLKSYFCQFWRV